VATAVAAAAAAAAPVGGADDVAVGVAIAVAGGGALAVLSGRTVVDTASSGLYDSCVSQMSLSSVVLFLHLLFLPFLSIT